MVMIVIDGSAGEGGGQVLRTALSLSLITGTPFRIEKIRANRKKGGLLRQHLTAVTGATQIGGASVEGAELGSTTLTFVPQRLQGGDYAFSIGSAGSTTLVLQTLLLPLAMADEPSTLTIDGGTHNPLAPPVDFIAEAFLPLLARIGAVMELTLTRHGFHPAGGGRIRLSVAPAKRLARLELEERGALVRRCVRAVVANLPYTIAEREVETAATELGWPDDCREAKTIARVAGPGNAVSVLCGFEQVTDVFTAFGERGVSAEQVAHSAAKQAKRYLNSGAAVGEHLADQLLLPLAVGEGGAFTTTPLSSHATTNIAVIGRFVDTPIVVEPIRNGLVRVRVG